jgi:23S rRNA pseudouridine2605 synthase
MAERLQKFLARAGVASRRKAEALIVQGRVQVNGQLAELGMKVTEQAEVRLDGELVSPALETVSYAFHKPVGVLSSVSDDRGRQTVMDFLPIPGLHPVGRLDLLSEGLLLLTNDGDLTLQLTHPRYGHEKAYRVWCAEGTPSAKDIRQLRSGLELDDGPARAVHAKAVPGGCLLVLAEGRKRQVRRMLGTLGYTVTRLLRTCIGGLELGELKPGEYRQLSGDDLGALGYTSVHDGSAKESDEQ